MALGDLGSTYTNIVVAGNSVVGVNLNEASAQIGTWSGWNIHSNADKGFQLNAIGIFGVLGTAKCWRNLGGGVSVGSSPGPIVTFDTWTFFGNNSSNFSMGSSATILELRSCSLNSDATFATTTNFSAGADGFIYLENCTLSNTVAATTDINALGTTNGYARLTMWGGSLAAATTVVATPSCYTGAVYLHNVSVSGTAHCYRAYTWAGTITNDTTHLDTGQALAWKIAPTANASAARPCVFPGPTKYETLRLDTFANPSPTISLSVNVYLSASGGTGATLVVKGGPVAGVGSWGTDSTAATTTTGSFQALTVSGLNPSEKGELEWYLSLDSSTTVAWVGDVTVTPTQAIDTTALQVTSRGLPVLDIYKPTGGLLRSAGMNGGFNN
jgi:hypothetical protein